MRHGASFRSSHGGGTAMLPRTGSDLSAMGDVAAWVTRQPAAALVPHQPSYATAATAGGRPNRERHPSMGVIGAVPLP
jgi:hypothetical protein